MSDTPEVAAARDRYRRCCVDLFEAENEMRGFHASLNPAFKKAACQARQALDEALTRQAQASEDGEAAHVIRLLFRREYPRLSDYAAGEAVAALRAAGFQITKKGAAP